jgi:hypothetical protein
MADFQRLTRGKGLLTKVQSFASNTRITLNPRNIHMPLVQYRLAITNSSLSNLPFSKELNLIYLGVQQKICASVIITQAYNRLNYKQA